MSVAVLTRVAENGSALFLFSGSAARGRSQEVAVSCAVTLVLPPALSSPRSPGTPFQASAAMAVGSCHLPEWACML